MKWDQATVPMRDPAQLPSRSALLFWRLSVGTTLLAAIAARSPKRRRRLAGPQPWVRWGRKLFGSGAGCEGCTRRLLLHQGACN
jgi:hypothetical protein